MSIPQQQPRTLSSIFELEFPQSVGIYSSYADAQKAVDFLADEKFEVRNLAIVGTDLKSVERVLGRRTWGTVILSGVQSGISTGLLVALVMLIFVRPTSFLLLLLAALVIGVALGVGFAAAAYAMTGGKRDFTSVTQTVATQVRGALRAQGGRPGARDAAAAAGRPRRRLRVGPSLVGLRAGGAAEGVGRPG